MKLIVKQGTTSLRLVIFVPDSSVSTGAGKTGLTNASSGLKWYYWRPDAGNAGGTSVSVVSATRGTFTSGGFIEIDSTNLPGFYEIGVPNAVIASTNAPLWAVMGLSGVTNMAPVNIEFQLVPWDITDSVRMGLTALPNASAASAGGLPTVGTGASQLDVDSSGRVNVGKWLGTAVTAGTTAGKPDVVVTTNNDKSAYTLSSLESPVLESGTAQAGGSLTITLRSGASATNSLYNGCQLRIYGGTGAGQARVITGYVGSTKVATMDATWTTNPDSTSTYAIAGHYSPALFSALAVTAASVSGSVGSVTGAVGSVTAGVTVSAGQFTVKKNTALNGFSFPMYDSTTHQSATGKTVTAQRFIDGGTVASCTNSVTEISNGAYTINFAAGDLNGNTILFKFSATGCDEVWFTIVTQA